VVETPVDSEYCSARQSYNRRLKEHGFQLDVQHRRELAQSLRISVLGLPFEDFEHGRGSPQVSTLWEIHPGQSNNQIDTQSNFGSLDTQRISSFR
jgi:hypothetical protein